MYLILLNNLLKFRFSTSDCGILIIFIIVAFLLSMFFEFLIHYRRKLLSHYKSNEVVNLNIKYKLVLTAFYFLVIVLANVHMFFVMSCNFYIILGLIIGNVVGFYIFGLDIEKREFESLLQYQ